MDPSPLAPAEPTVASATVGALPATIDSTPELRRRVRRALGAAIALLMVLGIGTEAARLRGYGTLLGLVRLFGLGEEANVPTWFASATLLLGAMLAGAVASLKLRSRDRFAGRWVALSVLVFLMSLDETAVIHETLSVVAALKLLQTREVPWYVYYAWIAPGLVVVGAILVWFHAWARSLQPQVRRHVTLAAILYFGGAVGIEVLEALLMASLGMARANTSFAYSALWMTQEGCEMAGVAAFILAMLDQLAADGVTLAVRVKG